MISILVRANVHTLKVKEHTTADTNTGGGDLPLHTVCQHQHQQQHGDDTNDRNVHVHYHPKTIQIMLHAYPESALVTGAMERLPLQMVCANGAQLSVVRMVLNGNPDAIYWKDSFDALALHLACKNSSEEVCLYLLGLYVYGAQIGDCWDKLPLHYACDRGISEALVRALLKRHPESIHCEDSTGRTPLDLARESKSSRREKILKILSDHGDDMLLLSKTNNNNKQKDETPSAVVNKAAGVMMMGDDDEVKKATSTCCAVSSDNAVSKPTHDLVDGVKAEFQSEIKEVRSELNDVKGMLNKILMIMGDKKSNGEEVV